MLQPRIYILATACLVSLLVGCVLPTRQLYEGAPRLPEAVATIEEDLSRPTRVKSIDGESVAGREWEVLPGEHLVVATSFIRQRIETDDFESSPQMTIRTTCKIRFEAEAGSRYLVTRRGSSKQSRRDVYAYELSVFAARFEEPDVPVGQFDCEPASANSFR